MNVTRSGDIYLSQLAKSGDWASPKPIAHKDKKILDFFLYHSSKGEIFTSLLNSEKIEVL